MRQQYAKNAPIPSMRQQYATGVTPTLLNSRPREIRSIGMSADKDGNASDFSSDDYLDDDAKNAKFADFVDEMNVEEDGNLKRTYSSANAS